VGQAPTRQGDRCSNGSPRYIEHHPTFGFVVERPRQRFSAVVNGNDYPCPYPARGFSQRPSVRLRSLVCEDDLQSGGTSRIIRNDGLVEFSLVHPITSANRGSDSRLYAGWLIGLIAGVVTQVNHVRSQLAWDAVEYGLEIQISSTAPLGVFWNDDGFSSGHTLKTELPLTLPRYSLAAGDDFDSLVTTVVRDLINSCGVSSEIVCSLPWNDLSK
jgi:hypothetical protein